MYGLQKRVYFLWYFLFIRIGEHSLKDKVYAMFYFLHYVIKNLITLCSSYSVLRLQTVGWWFTVEYQPYCWFTVKPFYSLGKLVMKERFTYFVPQKRQIFLWLQFQVIHSSSNMFTELAAGKRLLVQRHKEGFHGWIIRWVKVHITC